MASAISLTNRMTSAITQIERGFLEAAQLSDDWVRDMGNKALIKEAHHTTHIQVKVQHTTRSTGSSKYLRPLNDKVCDRFVTMLAT